MSPPNAGSAALPGPMARDLSTDVLVARRPTPPGERAPAVDWKHWLFERATLAFALPMAGTGTTER